MKNVRAGRVRSQTRATRQFLYVMDNPPSVSADDTRADKIGDIDGAFRAVASWSSSVTTMPCRQIRSRPSPRRSTSSSSARRDGYFRAGPVRRGGGVQKSVDQMTEAELAAVGVVAAHEDAARGSAAAGYASVQKIEGLAVLDNGQLALINDNDFGVAGIVIDNATGTFTIAPGYVPEKPTARLVEGAGPRRLRSRQRHQHPLVAGVRHVPAGCDRVVQGRQDDLPGHRQRR